MKKCEETTYRIYLSIKIQKHHHHMHVLQLWNKVTGSFWRLIATLQACAALKKGVIWKICRFITKTARDHSDYFISPFPQEPQFLWEDRVN